MKSCAIIPKVRTKDGSIRDSRLFEGLLSLTNNNRILTNKIYYKTKNKDFQKDYASMLKFDDAGEVTIESLVKAGLTSFIDEERLKESISKKYGFYDEYKPVYLPDTTENYQSSVQKAIEFNESSEYKDSYVAVVKRTSDRSIYVSLEKNDTGIQSEASRMKASYNLNSKIREFLRKHGISIGALNTLDLALGRQGVTDFSKAFNKNKTRF